jgi:hypothetical protein
MRLTSQLLTDFFDKLTFNAQCLYGVVLDRPLEEKDFVSLAGSEATKTFTACYMHLTHDEQKEILKAILGSKTLFDSIVGRMALLETNIVTWDANLEISNETLNDMINRDTYETFNYAFTNIATAILKVSPTLFQKLVVLGLRTGFDIDSIVDRLGKKYRAAQKESQNFLKDLFKQFKPPTDQPPIEGDLPPGDEE